MTEENTVPAIYAALLAIQNEYAVEKKGKLPSNMGGSMYAAASDQFAEFKKLAQKHRVLTINQNIPSQTELREISGRAYDYVVVTLSYKLVSLEDGSSETISGTGTGIAINNSVASIIANTNAMKTAIQGFTMTTESSEDAAKSGPGESEGGPTKAEQKVAAAKTGVAPATGAIPTDEVKELQGKIKAAADARRAVETDFPTHMQFATKFLGSESQGWSKDAEKLQRVLQAIEGGVVA